MKPLPLSEEGKDALERWTPKARALLEELVEDAGSGVQVELLARAVASGHTPAEVHAFADAVRALSDEESWAACTLEAAPPGDLTIAQLLRAEADPLYAYELQGGRLDPSELEDAELLAPLAPPMAAAPRAAPLAPMRTGRKDVHDLGGDLSVATAPAASAPRGASPAQKFLEDLAAEATRPLNLGWREQELDVEGGLSLDEALPAVVAALQRGLPVPCAIGPRPKDSRRLALFVQLNVSGKTRAFQLYDPLSGELAWTNEGDLLARTELPFANKANRRLTRLVLPLSKGGSF